MRRSDTGHRPTAGAGGSAAGSVDRPLRPAGEGDRDRLPGPRQEYLDAFDAPAARSAGPGPAGRDGPDGRDGRRAARRPAGTAVRPGVPAQGGPRDAAGEAPPDAPGDADGSRPAADAGRARGGGARHRRTPEPRGRGWGRTLTGLAAAGVVTALAITITGQLAEERPAGPGAGRGEQTGLTGSTEPADDGAAAEEPGGAEPDGSGPAGEEDDPVEDDGRETGESVTGGGGGGGAGPQAPVYEEVMDSVFDLDPELTASGELVPVPGTDPGPDPDAPEQLRYRVDVEKGVDFAPEIFAEAVHRTLSDPRSWGNDGRRSFTRVSSGRHDFVITLASPGTTAEWCAKSGLDTTVENVSCDSANTERVMINAWRWAQGADTYGPDRIHEYRQMLINHEVGHRIGYGHAVCPAHGELAPVMMQQTKFLTMNGVTCEPNAWPHP